MHLRTLVNYFVIKTEEKIRDGRKYRIAVQYRYRVYLVIEE